MQHNPSESIRLVVERGYADYARAKFANSQARLDDLEQLSQYALRYDDTNLFLDEVALANPIAGEDVAVVGPEDEKVVLSSVHQAKGLEWRIVFVIWLADGRFPSQRALRVPGGIVRVQPKELHEAFELTDALMKRDDLAIEELPAEIVDDAAPTVHEIVIPGEEEERRLFYVAVTRAKAGAVSRLSGHGPRPRRNGHPDGAVALHPRTAGRLVREVGDRGEWVIGASKDTHRNPFSLGLV